MKNHEAITLAIEALVANKQWLEQLHNSFKEDWHGLHIQTARHLDQTEQALTLLKQAQEPQHRRENDK